MKEDNRFANELIRIVNGALRLDIDKVRNYTAFLADKLQATGDVVTAERLRKSLQDSDTSLRPVDARHARALPVDAETRFPLLELVSIAPEREAHVHLLPQHWDIVNEFVSVATSSAAYEGTQFDGAMSFLMYGAPGNGKSRLARHIAVEMGLPLYLCRLDGMISSYLGSTSKNIRAVFEFTGRMPCILFLDEFDAIAKLRGDSQELGELKRVVNSFLQNLDTLGRHTIVIAATNHEGLLDAAVWRRFTYRLALSAPTLSQRQDMWSDFGTGLGLEQRQLEMLSDLSEGLSGSDLREICNRVNRKTLISGTRAELKDVFPVLLNMTLGRFDSACFAASLQELDTPHIVRRLRERNSKLYSYASVAELLGLSKAGVHRLSRLETDEND